jgi:methionine salvage enolase-phosphatase E1
MEDGDINSYYSSNFILGNIHKTKSVQSYVDYVQDKTIDPPGLMFMYDTENVIAVDGVHSNGGIEITYEEANGLKQNVIFDDPNDALTYGRAPSPANLPDWNALPDGVFG